MSRQNYGQLFVVVLIFILSSVAYRQFSQVSASAHVSAAAAPTPGLWVTPLEIDLGPVGVGDTTAIQKVTITNVGTATLTNFAGGGVNASFSAAQNCASGVPPGGSCQYSFTFTPTTEGQFTATSSSSTNGGLL